MRKRVAPRKRGQSRRRGATVAENSDGSASSGKRGRGPGRPFKPGQSGNPGGRPRALTELKERIQLRGADLVDHLLAIADETPKMKGSRVVGPGHRERILAIKEL